MRVFSFGGGVQSVAVLVLAAQERVQYDAFLFCNVGHDSENPDTLDYFDEIVQPYAAAHNIRLEVLERRNRRTLYQSLVSDNRSIDIPARMANGAPGNRNCTATYKIKLVASWLKRHGASAENPATVGLGISMDEIQRMNESRIPHVRNEWPLIDLRLRRSDCMSLIADAGLPVPPKSACWFCPFKSPAQWQDMKRERPDLFDKAVALEQRINEKRASIGRDAVYLHRSAKPLQDAVSDQTAFFDQLDMCESGYCLT